MQQAESRKRPTWVQYRAWSRLASGVLRSVMGAGQYGTTTVFSKIVPHVAAQELRPYLHHVRAPFSKTGQEVVRVGERRGLPRAHQLDAPLAHSHSKGRCHVFPAHCGHHLNPLAGFWRVMKDASGAGRCLANPPSVIAAHTLGTPGASRATDLCIPLVAYSASDFAGSAYTGVTEVEALGMSVLGRDVTNLFAVIVDWSQQIVNLLGQRHQYTITQQ
jgi:hypothetical protein